MLTLTCRVVEVLGNSYLEILRRHGNSETLLLRRWCHRTVAMASEEEMIRFLLDELYEAWAIKYDYPMP